MGFQARAQPPLPEHLQFNPSGLVAVVIDAVEPCSWPLSLQSTLKGGRARPLFRSKETSSRISQRAIRCALCSPSHASPDPSRNNTTPRAHRLFACVFLPSPLLRLSIHDPAPRDSMNPPSAHLRHSCHNLSSWSLSAPAADRRHSRRQRLAPDLTSISVQQHRRG